MTRHPLWKVINETSVARRKITNRWGIFCSKGHRENCHGLPSRLKQSYHHPPEYKSIEHHNYTDLYAPITDYDNDAVEDSYDHLQEILYRSPKEDMLVVSGDWNAKVGEDAFKNWKGICSGRYCNAETNERGLRLLKFAYYNVGVLANTLGKHKASRRWTWHSANGEYLDRIDCNMVRWRFMTGVNTAKTRVFPEADIGRDHDLVMMTFTTHKDQVRSPEA